MKSFFRTLFLTVILSALLSVPASYFFVKDFVQPRVDASLETINTVNENLVKQNEMLEQILQDLKTRQ